jgi:hypothetical protein
LMVIAIDLPLSPRLRTFGGYGAPLSWLAPPGWVDSLVYQLQQASAGRLNYLNGSVSRNGFPLYYVEAFVLKTTLGFLALALAAGVLQLKRREREALLYIWLPVAVIFLVPSLSRLDLGVRYVLPAYPLLAVSAGALLAPGLWPRVRVAARVAVAVCILAVAASSLGHRPQHIGYFNEFASTRPERYLSNSNIDWGQDAWRLREWWEGQGRPPLYVVYFGGLPLSNFGVTSRDLDLTQEPPRGRLAISLNALAEQSQTEHGSYHAILECPDLGQRIGTSIQLADATATPNFACAVRLSGLPPPPAGP